MDRAPIPEQAEPVAEPIAEPIAEQNARPIAEPIAEPNAEPIAEPIVEPIAEPIAEPNPPALLVEPENGTWLFFDEVMRMAPGRGDALQMFMNRSDTLRRLHPSGHVEYFVPMIAMAVRGPTRSRSRSNRR